MSFLNFSVGVLEKWGAVEDDFGEESREAKYSWMFVFFSFGLSFERGREQRLVFLYTGVSYAETRFLAVSGSEIPRAVPPVPCG